jgi:hypothetical protein
LAIAEARAVLVSAIVTGFAPVRLAFAWRPWFRGRCHEALWLLGRLLREPRSSWASPSGRNGGTEPPRTRLASCAVIRGVGPRWPT